MATMVKEPKRREKKRVKEKSAPRSSTESEQPSILCDTRDTEDIATTSKTVDSSEQISCFEQPIKSLEQGIETGAEDLKVEQISTIQDINKIEITDQSSTSEETIVSKLNIESIIVNLETEPNEIQSEGDTYHDINVRLERIAIPSLDPNLNLEDIQNRLENPQAYMRLDKIMEAQSRAQSQESERVAPSAPVFEEPKTIQYFQQTEEIVVTQTKKTKPQCMQLEEAIKLYGGAEMERVRVISEKEEAIVEAGPVCGPEHPLVDLLSTFRSSLIAVDKVRLQLAKDNRDEENHRNKLWKVEKRSARASEQCKCGARVSVLVPFDHAELNYGAFPAARLRLERLKRDVQESFCHHQHEALFTHCQIDELVSETVKGHKKEIREALALVLQALRRSDSAPESLGAALQRWAAALSAALLDNRDISHLIHLLHHLFRQSRSVRWAARVVRSYIRAGDRSEAATAIGLLDLLLARTHMEAALECVEDAEESWEEMDKSGSGAVCDGALRERDLLELLRAFPTRELVARIVLFAHNDVSVARAQEWGDRSGGGGVLRACCGARALLHSLRRAVHAHPTYTRLHAVLEALAVNLLHALAGLHLHSSDYYTKELEEKISAELEACFCAGAALLGDQLQDLPATLLSGQAAGEYCCVNILALHDKDPKQLDFLQMTLPVMSCSARVGLVTQAALDRSFDHELARTVMDFLLQTALKRAAALCGGGCAGAARAHLPRLLHAHAYLHTLALHTLTEYHQVEPLDQSAIPALAPQWWRPTPGEARQLLDDWGARCPHLIQHLLLQLDYTPHCGISLETQLVILHWLCGWQPAAPPEWAWLVLRRARTHRAWWAAPAEAPPPDPPPEHLLGNACAVLASSWGHSIPLICSEGVSALVALARARPADAAHCLAPVMALMAHSPESVALTPKFDELFGLLLRAGPTVVQRALGWGPEPTATTLLRLILAQIEGDHPHVTRSAVVSAWLHALWKPALPAPALVETILLASRDWLLFDAHATRMMQDEKSPELVLAAVQNAGVAPLACACVLRARAGGEARAGGALLDALHVQRMRGEKIHVDNAIKSTGGRTRSCDLALYRCGEALLCAPAQGPAHLTLWALFLHLYLQRPPTMSNTTPPTGPLFYTGFSKSRTLVQLMRKLQEVIMYHQNEAETLKKNHREAPPRPQNTNTRSKQTKNVPEDGVLPALNIRDLRGESSDSCDSESDTSEEIPEARSENSATEKREDLGMLIKYHKAAEDMCKLYLRWLDEGDKTSAMPHHAEIARFIPEQVLVAAWSRELAQRRPPPAEDQPPPIEPPPPPLPTPFQATVARILTINDHSRKRSRRLSIRSPLEDLDMRDARALLALVDKYLADVTTLAEEWRSDVSRLTALDGALLELVSRLRVGGALPSQRQRCPNKCSPVTLYPQGTNWTVSSDAERGIEENRRAARALTRRLARPRPHAARSAAALLTIARRVSSVETAHRVCERAWGCARAGDQCAPASTTLTALVEQLADRWLCHNGKICSELISRWGHHSSSALQQALCGALVAPRRLPAPHWPPVYCAVLRSRLPAHIIFSYLSKFEMSRWAEVGDAALRRELLEALVTAAQGFGLEPDPECHVLLELLGVHTATLLNPAEVCAHVTRCAHASVARALPPAYWPHVTRAAQQHACNVPFDQLGHLLRSLGALWWETRSQLAGEGGRYSAYAPPTAGLLQALAAAFTAAATALSYAPQRVALYVWSALQESWGPWVAPHACSLLQADDLHTAMLKHLVHTIEQVMAQCPGIAEELLQKVFEWVVQTAAGAHAAPAHARVQLSALLAETAALPWTSAQWMQPQTLHIALQACSSDNRELQSWCSAAWRCIAAETWVGGAAEQQIAPLLASLLYLFTAMQQHEETIEQATRLPWWRLPEPALEEALERFFAQHHNPATPYHELPQFKVVLFASELCIHPSHPPPSLHTHAARSKRGACVSRWTLCACALTLAQHASGHATHMLHTLAGIAPHLERSVGEMEELLSRALAIMCMEPAASKALPVWCEWVCGEGARLAGACVSAASTLTVFEAFAKLADAAIRAHCSRADNGGWPAVYPRLSTTPWREAHPLATRGRLHAAYAVTRAHQQTHANMQTAFRALANADINYIENEPIYGVWLCAACRHARAWAGAGGEGAESGAAARALLERAGAEPRRNLLKIVTMQADSGSPTPRHRLLARLALCLASPSEGAARGYQASCAAVLGSSTDALAWGSAPEPKHLPRLAMRVFPNDQLLFKDELDLAPEDV